MKISLAARLLFTCCHQHRVRGRKVRAMMKGKRTTTKTASRESRQLHPAATKNTPRNRRNAGGRSWETRLKRASKALKQNRLLLREVSLGIVALGPILIVMIDVAKQVAHHVA